MTTPIPGSTLSSSAATFGWNTGNGVDQYFLYVGTTGVGSANIFSASTGVTQSATVTVYRHLTPFTFGCGPTLPLVGCGTTTRIRVVGRRR